VWVVSTYTVQPARAPVCQILAAISVSAARASKSASACSLGKTWGKVGGGSGGWALASKPQTCMPAGRSLPALSGRISVATVPAPCPERWSDSAERQIPQTSLHMQLRLRRLVGGGGGEGGGRGKGGRGAVPYYTAIQSSVPWLCRRPRERNRNRKGAPAGTRAGTGEGTGCGVMLHGPITCSCLEDLCW
jgi:hypothetical protein